MSIRTKLLWLPISLLCLPSFLTGQTAAPACNDQDRIPTTDAGSTSTGTTNCPTFSITVQVGAPPLSTSLTFNSPPSCDIGRRQQDEDCFRCGMPSKGNQCTANAFSVMVEIFSIGGGSPCPIIPTPFPMTVAEAQEATMCRPLPSLGVRTNYCAGSKACSGGNEIVLDASKAPRSMGEGLGERIYFEGDPYDVLPKKWGTSRTRAIQSLPRSHLDSLPPVLRSVVEKNPRLDGIDHLSVSMIRTFRNRGAGSKERVNTRQFHGVVLADGSFTLSSPRIALNRDEQQPFIEEMSYDGSTFFLGTKGKRVYQAYGAEYFDLAYILRCKASPVDPIVTWLRAPVGVEMLPGASYETTHDPERDLYEVFETYPSVQVSTGDAGLTRYLIQGKADELRMILKENRSSDGRLFRRQEFGDHREVSPGVWRPFLVTETRHDPLDLEAPPWLETKMQVESGTPLTLREIQSDQWTLPLVGEERWYLYL